MQEPLWIYLIRQFSELRGELKSYYPLISPPENMKTRVYSKWVNSFNRLYFKYFYYQYCCWILLVPAARKSVTFMLMKPAPGFRAVRTFLIFRSNTFDLNLYQLYQLGHVKSTFLPISPIYALIILWIRKWNLPKIGQKCIEFHFRRSMRKRQWRMDPKNVTSLKTKRIQNVQLFFILLSAMKISENSKHQVGINRNICKMLKIKNKAVQL